MLPELGDESFFIYEKQDNSMKNYAINFLTKQNDSARFVPDFLKEYGMPLWDNEIVFDYQGAKVLLFPVKEFGKKELSAILYFIFSKDGLSFNTLTRNMNNPEFGDSESLFLWIESNMFGISTRGNLRVESLKRDPTLKGFIEVERCWHVYTVDNGVETYRYTMCSYQYFWFDNPFGGFSGSSPYDLDGGYDFDSGGSGGSTNPPPADPPPVNPILTVDNPCELVSLHAEDEALRNLLNNLRISARTSKYEEGYILTNNSNFSNNGGLFNTEYVTSNAIDYIDVQLAPGQTIDGFIHTHTDSLVPMFSAEDVAKIYEWYQSGHIQNLNTFTMILLNVKDDTSFSISIHDPTLFVSFFNNFFSSSQDIQFLTQNISIWEIFGQEALMKGFLIAFKDAGISLFKEDKDFSQWNRHELNQNGGVVTNNCPN